jgi:outer membrane protein assembly factor BamA
MTQSSRCLFRLQWRIILVLPAVLVALLCIPAEPAKKSRARQTAPVIRFIIIDPKDVFDPNVPGEGQFPFTWANALHIRTKDHVVRRELLVKPGDRANPDLLEESERILRALTFIKDARIKTVPVGDGRVDVLVETHDTWTTQPQANFGSEGGENEFEMGFLEENLLGYGKSISYFYKDHPEGISRQYSYSDPQLFRTRTKFTSQFDDTPTGTQQHLGIERPFYSLETKWAGGGVWHHTDEDQQIIENGVQTNTFGRDHHDADVFVGRRLNRDPLSVHRLSLHYTYFSDFFTRELETATTEELPENKTITGPSLRWDWVQSNFIKETFIDRAERVEDFNLGHQVILAAGYSGQQFGATEEAVPITFADSFGMGKEGRGFFLGSYGMTGRMSTYGISNEGGKLQNTLYFLNANYYKHLPTEFPFTGVLHFESAYVQNIDEENQLELGGDNGLRGFEAHAFTGNKSLLMNIEGRAYYPHEIFHLAYIGGAAFVDAGQVQPPGSPYTWKDVHASIGVGFRIALTRSTEGSVYRFDVAYALGPIQQDNRIVFSIAAGQGFKKAGNSYEKFPGVPVKSD